MHYEIFSSVFDAILPHTKNYDVAYQNAIDIADAIYDAHYGVQWAFPLDFKNTKEIFTLMPKKATQKESSPAWKGFINIYMDAIAKEHFLSEEWHTDDEIPDLLNSLIATGHALSLKWDSKSECFMSAMRGENPDSPNAGYCVTSRHPDALTALHLALYKHYIMCDCDWTQYAKLEDGKGWG